MLAMSSARAQELGRCDELKQQDADPEKLSITVDAEIGSQPSSESTSEPASFLHRVTILLKKWGLETNG